MSLRSNHFVVALEVAVSAELERNYYKSSRTALDRAVKFALLKAKIDRY